MHLTDMEKTVYAEALIEHRTPDLTEKVIDHVSDCVQCSSEILELKNLIADYNSAPKSKSKTAPIIYSIAASILIFIVSYSLVYNGGVDSSFPTNPFLEELVNQRLRAGEFELVKPQNEMVISSKIITFIWKSNYDKLNLVLLDANEKLLYQENMATSPIEINNKFDEGVIYWKLETEEELVFVGKFINSPIPLSK